MIVQSRDCRVCTIKGTYGIGKETESLYLSDAIELFKKYKGTGVMVYRLIKGQDKLSYQTISRDTEMHTLLLLKKIKFDNNKGIFVFNEKRR